VATCEEVHLNNGKTLSTR